NRYCDSPQRFPPAAPCDSSMQTRRVKPSAGWREGLSAGTIASRKGSANEAPVPRRKVRRESCFPVMKFMAPPPLVCGGSGLSHLEGVALHDAQDQRRHLVS